MLLGQSCALSGPAKNLGLEMQAGIKAAMAEINNGGGIKGRKIGLVSLDDGYAPDRAVKNTRRLIENNEVFLLIGEVGTPTSKAVVPLVEKYRVPFFAPLTGAEFLRKPFRRYVVNLRVSYSQEAEKLVTYLLENKKTSKISCFYQNDSYGFAGLEGVKKSLQKRGLQLLSTGSYERNTIAVMGGLKEIYKAEPEAVILIGTYQACAEFIKLSKAKNKSAALFAHISFVGTEGLRKSLGAYGEKVVVSQVVPFPWNDSLPIVRDYRAAMHKYQRNIPLSFVSLEGYIAGRLFAEIARSVPGELRREKFIQTMEEMGHFNLGGINFKFGPDDHQGMDCLYLTTIYPVIQKIEN